MVQYLMIKLSEQEKNIIIEAAFLDELEKQAFWATLGRAALKIIPAALRSTKALKATNTAKWAKGGVTAIKKGKGTKYLKQFAAPTNQMSKATLKGGKTLKINRMQQVGGSKGTLARGLRTSVGNMAQNVSTLGKGVKGQGFIGGTKQFGKNILTTSKRQLRGSQFKEVTLGKGQTVVKGKGLLGKSKFFDRKIVGTTSRGTGIVKKRALVRPLSATLTAPGMAATGMIAGKPKEEGTTVGQQKANRSVSGRVGHGLKEGLPWLVGAPVGMASMLLGGKKNKKNKEEDLYSQQTRV